MIKRQGRYTVKFTEEPLVSGFASVVGKVESEGPLGKCFDKVIYDSHASQNTFEQAESLMQREALTLCLEKWGGKAEDADYVFAGDLLNQCTASAFGMKSFPVPFLGQYGACSTSAQNLIMSAIFTSGNAAGAVLSVCSSHFCTAERQFRFPLEYGAVRTPTAQRTVTAAAAFAVESRTACAVSSKSPLICPKIREATVGKIVDMGVTDANNMGAAMAPAAADTLKTYFEDSGKNPQDFDGIFTGDLGKVGSDILIELLKKDGYDLSGIHDDCGLMIYDIKSQEVNAGGSGCGCGAAVLASHILPSVCSRKYSDVLYVATGALMSSTSGAQGENIPAVAHLIRFTAPETVL